MIMLLLHWALNIYHWNVYTFPPNFSLFQKSGKNNKIFYLCCSFIRFKTSRLYNALPSRPITGKVRRKSNQSWMKQCGFKPHLHLFLLSLLCISLPFVLFYCHFFSLCLTIFPFRSSSSSLTTSTPLPVEGLGRKHKGQRRSILIWRMSRSRSTSLIQFSSVKSGSPILRANFGLTRQLYFISHFAQSHSR